MIKTLAGALFVLFGCSNAKAWGPMAHRAIATVAQKRLTPETLAAVRGILGEKADLAKIANCADDMLYAQGMFDCGGLFSFPADPAKTTRRWHFIDIPLSESSPADNLMTYCPEGKDCLPEQIRRQAGVLRDRDSTSEEKRLALMFLVHFVGDVHQPFHCADDADWGGNKKGVSLYGTQKNLHSLWDDLILVEDWKAQTAMDPDSLVADLESEIGRWNTRSWTAGDHVARSTVESFEYAKAAYAQYAQDHGQGLDEHYQEPAWMMARLRLEMAGVRLAAILEDSLKADRAVLAPSVPAGVGENARRMLEPRDPAALFDGTHR